MRGIRGRHPPRRERESVWASRGFSGIQWCHEKRRGEERRGTASPRQQQERLQVPAGADPEVSPLPCRQNYGADQSEMPAFPIASQRSNAPSNHGNGDTALPFRPPILDAHRRRTMGEWQRPIFCPSEIGKCCCPWLGVPTAPPHRPAPGRHWPSSPWQPLSLTARGNAPNAGRWPGQMSKLLLGDGTVGPDHRTAGNVLLPAPPPHVALGRVDGYKMDMPSSSSSSPFLSSSLRSCQLNQQALSLFFASSLGTTTLVLYHA